MADVSGAMLRDGVGDGVLPVSDAVVQPVKRSRAEVAAKAARSRCGKAYSDGWRGRRFTLRSGRALHAARRSFVPTSLRRRRAHRTCNGVLRANRALVLPRGTTAAFDREWRGRGIRCILMCSDASAPGYWQLHSVTTALRQKEPLERGHGDDRFRHRLRICVKRAEDAGLSRERSLRNNNCRKEAVRLRPRCLSSEPESVNP